MTTNNQEAAMVDAQDESTRLSDDEALAIFVAGWDAHEAGEDRRIAAQRFLMARVFPPPEEPTT